jgi:selenide, water dikinase
MRPLKDVFSSFSCPELLLGMDAADDAAVYQISDSSALVFTTDFFTPVVDDPESFGAIAAANSMSDIFAMGGQVILALNIAGFPDKLSEATMELILRGGAEKVFSAGGIIVGGHTINSTEPFYGLAVCGMVHPQKMLAKTGAKPGDLLVLTKSLGTGIVATALKGGVCEKLHLDQATKTMMQLNRNAALAAAESNACAATDVTGFGFVGHALEIASSSKITLKISFDDIPFLPGANEYARQWLFPVGATRNEKAFGKNCWFDQTIPKEDQMLLFTPETSGGLLIALSESNFKTFEKSCKISGQRYAVIGHAEKGDSKIIVQA